MYPESGVLFSNKEKRDIKPQKDMVHLFKCMLVRERSKSEKATYRLVPTL